MKRLFLICLIVFTMVSLIGSPMAEERTKYVASTSWTAAFASIATGENVKAIAPTNLKHPPEYEITADDILCVSYAQLFVYAGYERMMNTIAEASTINKENLVKISTKNTYEDIEKGVFEIAKVAGTEAIAKENLKTYKAFFEETKKEMEERDFTNKTVFVNVNQEPFARALGLNVVGTFGPSPVTAAEIALCSEQGFDLIIDNVHNIVSEPLKDVSPSSKFVIWRNFPETEGSPEALLEVMENNVKALIN